MHAGPPILHSNNIRHNEQIYCEYQKRQRMKLRSLYLSREFCMEALNLQQMVSSQLIPSDVELPYGSIWRKNNNCLKRTIIVSIYAVVVCGVMSRKPPCPGIIQSEKQQNKKEVRKRVRMKKKRRQML